MNIRFGMQSIVHLTAFAFALLCSMTWICNFAVQAADAGIAIPNDDRSLMQEQKEIISKLSGTADIRHGVKLTDRFSAANKKEARAYLGDLLKKSGLEPKYQGFDLDSKKGENVYAVLQCGIPSAEIIIVGAHFDTTKGVPGANDNASGVSAVVALAEHMSHFKGRINRDIAFVFFDEEERGMMGSQAFAEMLKKEKRLVNSVHTIDQIGWDQNGNRAIELELPYVGATALYQKTARSLGMDIVIWVTDEEGSDHTSFRDLGFKSVGVTEEYRHKDTSPYGDTPRDKEETMDYKYLASTTLLLSKVLETLATSADESATGKDVAASSDTGISKASFAAPASAVEDAPKTSLNPVPFKFAGNFSEYSPGCLPSSWRTSGFWEIKDGKLHSTDQHQALAFVVNAPCGKEMSVEAELTSQSVPCSDWKRCGIAVFSDINNYWLLSLTEFPNKGEGETKRIIELSEMLEGHWQAEADASSALAEWGSAKGEKWSAGTGYRLRLVFESDSFIRGIVFNQIGEVVWQHGFEFDAGRKAVKTGTPALWNNAGNCSFSKAIISINKTASAPEKTVNKGK